MIERVTGPAGALVSAVRRPETYPAQVREITSTLLTAALWPLGFTDLGLTPAERDQGGRPGPGPDSPVETPVLLLHGFGATKSNWLFLTRFLRMAGFERVHALNYNPFRADLPALAARCADEAERLKERYGTSQVHLVGHSLGGVIVRYAVQVDGLEGVGLAATISSPHGGNRLARHGRVLARGPFASGVQLSPDSTVMRLFRSTARPLPTRFVAYYSNLDLIVPARRAMILEPELEATNVLVKDHGHVSIMLSRRLGASLVEELAATEGLAGWRRGDPEARAA